MILVMNEQLFRFYLRILKSIIYKVKIMETKKLFKNKPTALLQIFLILLALCSFTMFDKHHKQTDKAIDLVCGMKVDKSEGYISKYKGTKYYFDKVECKKTFDMNPQKFIDNKCTEVKTDTLLKK